MNWLLAFAGPALSAVPLMATFNASAAQCGMGLAVRSDHQATAAL